MFSLSLQAFLVAMLSSAENIVIHSKFYNFKCYNVDVDVSFIVLCYLYW